MFSNQQYLPFSIQEKGGLTIISAIIFPIILSFCLLAFDGAKLITKKARLEDALTEAALAITSRDKQNANAAEKIELESMLNNYISTYLPNDSIKNSHIDIRYISDPQTGNKVQVFDIKAQVEINTILPLSFLPAFSPKVELKNLSKICQEFQDIGKSALMDFSSFLHNSAGEIGCPVFRR